MPFFRNLWQRLSTAAPSSAPSATSSSGTSDDEESGSESTVASHSSDVDSGEDEDANNRDGLLLALKRRKQTEKARAAALLAKQRRRFERESWRPAPAHPAILYKPDLQPQPEINRPGNFTQTIHRRRLRVVFSWFQAWCSALGEFLRPIGIGGNGNHCFTVNIVDDSNFRLAQVLEGAPNWRGSRVISVMNLVQSIVVSYEDSGKTCQRTFMCHTPLVTVPKTNAATLGLELQSWLLTFLGKVGRRFQLFGMSWDAFDMFPIQGTLLVWDSLVTNISVLKRLRILVQIAHQENGHSVLYPVLANICALHQCSLLRKPLVHHFPGCWSTITRLAHLFEVSTFRQQFRSALVQVVCASFKYVQVAKLPTQAKEWRQTRNRSCGMFSSDPSYPKQRCNLHAQLAQFDNGDPQADDFAHFCTGACCCGRDPTEKRNYALLQVCRLFSLLFGHGFPVPLLYRWTHGHRALEFVKEAW